MRVWCIAVLSLAACLLPAAVTAQPRADRLTDADLPLLLKYLPLEAGEFNRYTREAMSPNPPATDPYARFRAGSGMSPVEQQLQRGEVTQLDLLMRGGAEGIDVPEGATFDAPCSKQWSSDVGHALFSGTRVANADEAQARVAQWVAWYEAHGYRAVPHDTNPNVVTIQSARGVPPPQSVRIILYRVEPVHCNDGQPYISVHGDDDLARRVLPLVTDRSRDPGGSAYGTTGLYLALARDGVDVALYERKRMAVRTAYAMLVWDGGQWGRMMMLVGPRDRDAMQVQQMNAEWLRRRGGALLPLLARVP